MRKLPFKKSALVSIGVELEFQLINPKTWGHRSCSKDLIRDVPGSGFETRIVPEITQSMIEINSSVHQSAKTMLEEFSELQVFLLQEAEKLGAYICGGGSHPYERWTKQKIFPAKRYKNLARKYRYLSKRATIFGQHIHIGCSTAEDALYLTHALGRYVPQFIALAASSPFYQGVDTGYCSSRSSIFSAFPLSGVIPYLINWNELSEYYYKLRRLGIIGSMKDFYWDIRPKPEFGTVEVRVCDTPLTLGKAVQLAAYLQSLSLYLLEERPTQVSHDLYFLYSYNRFQGSRYGFEGDIINSDNGQHCLIQDDILNTLKKINQQIEYLGNTAILNSLQTDTLNKVNDASLLRKVFKESGSLNQVVKLQCELWKQPLDKYSQEGIDSLSQ
ncbi:carboxylate-amine ligase [Legionella birminghamensis]|uniref:Putative glutamate--cysteine ligase 2 n=1 Tax=Legionella birminghamensis TaxID=28083 RepID=A0A378IB50_9GAMM|nr:YbdK family carboxylate-amine ligase [Legionella birminghamensis]KTC71704.1 carboxylate-amine ligase [Legionella birminghamensis]STX32458.1 carboxylate-amine ligase [Legionella birminghamensis]